MKWEMQAFGIIASLSQQLTYGINAAKEITGCRAATTVWVFHDAKISAFLLTASDT